MVEIISIGFDHIFLMGGSESSAIPDKFHSIKEVSLTHSILMKLWFYLSLGSRSYSSCWA